MERRSDRVVIICCTKWVPVKENVKRKLNTSHKCQNDRIYPENAKKAHVHVNRWIITHRLRRHLRTERTHWPVSAAVVQLILYDTADNDPLQPDLGENTGLLDTWKEKHYNSPLSSSVNMKLHLLCCAPWLLSTQGCILSLPRDDSSLKIIPLFTNSYIRTINEYLSFV